MSGCSVIRSGWIVSMDGKEAMLIGGPMPSAMTVTGRIAMVMFSLGVKTGVEKIGRTDIDSARKTNRIKWKPKN